MSDGSAVSERREPADFFLRFCECLNSFDVRYVVVGSEAVAFHGAPRYSADFDTFVLATRANLFRVVAALQAFGLTDLSKTIDPEVWAKTGATLRLGEPPTQVDVLLQLSGVDFHRVAVGAVDGRYGDVLDYLHEVEHAGDRLTRLERAIDDAVQTAPTRMRAVIAALQALRAWTPSSSAAACADR